MESTQVAGLYPRTDATNRSDAMDRFHFFAPGFSGSAQVGGNVVFVCTGVSYSLKHLPAYVEVVARKARPALKWETSRKIHGRYVRPAGRAIAAADWLHSVQQLVHHVCDEDALDVRLQSAQSTALDLSDDDLLDIEESKTQFEAGDFVVDPATARVKVFGAIRAVVDPI